VTIGHNTSLATSVVSLDANVVASSTSITIKSRTAAAATSSFNDIFQNGTVIEFSGHYFV
jgi:hypothetical protein